MSAPELDHLRSTGFVIVFAAGGALPPRRWRRRDAAEGLFVGAHEPREVHRALPELAASLVRAADEVRREGVGGDVARERRGGGRGAALDEREAVDDDALGRPPGDGVGDERGVHHGGGDDDRGGSSRGGRGRVGAEDGALVAGALVAVARSLRRVAAEVEAERDALLHVGGRRDARRPDARRRVERGAQRSARGAADNPGG